MWFPQTYMVSSRNSFAAGKSPLCSFAHMPTVSDFSCAGDMEGTHLALTCRMMCPSPSKMLLLRALTCCKSYKDMQRPSARRVASPRSLKSSGPAMRGWTLTCQEKVPAPQHNHWQMTWRMNYLGLQPMVGSMHGFCWHLALCQRPEGLFARYFRGDHPHFLFGCSGKTWAAANIVFLVASHKMWERSPWSDREVILKKCGHFLHKEPWLLTIPSCQIYPRSCKTVIP